MFTIKLIFVFGVLINFAWARPETQLNDESPTVPSVSIPSDADKETVPIPSDGIVNGLIFNYTSPNYMEHIESAPVEAEGTSNLGGLVRKKRFLLNLLVGPVLRSFRNNNWRECGRTPWGTTIYTNGYATACYGACPEEVYCGYGYGYGYGRK